MPLLWSHGILGTTLHGCLRSTGVIYVEWHIEKVQCCALVDTSMEIILVQFGILHQHRPEKATGLDSYKRTACYSLRRQERLVCFCYWAPEGA